MMASGESIRWPISETVWSVANFGSRGLKIFIPSTDFDSREQYIVSIYSS